VTYIIDELKTHYNPEEVNLCYLTLHQPNMVNALNSGSFNLQGTPTNQIVSQFMGMVNHFINSNAELNLSQNFQIYCKILSYSHFLWPKNRRKQTKTLGCKTGDEKLNISGIAEIDRGFPGNESIFENKCLLTSVLLCFYANEFFRTKKDDNTHLLLQPLYKKSVIKKTKVSMKMKIAAGELLLEKVNNLISILKLPLNGPYVESEVIPKLCEYFNSEIHIIKSNQEKVSIIESYPSPEWHNNLQQIFLFPTEENHVVPVINAKLFFNQNKHVCLVCKITFAEKHSCPNRKKMCSKCCCYFADRNTLIQDNLPFRFCLSNLEIPLPDPVICSLCNFSFLSATCFENHKKICGIKAKKSRRGFYCDNCKTFNQTNIIHVCKERDQLICPYCKEIYLKIDFHCCKLQKETLSNSWRKLIFFNFEYENLSTYNCPECFMLRKHYQESNNLKLNNFVKSLDFHNLKCQHHASNSSESNPNLCTLWEETSLGNFDEHTFANDSLKIQPFFKKDVFSYNYDSFDANPQKFQPLRTPRRVQTTKYRVNIINNQNEKKVVDYFAEFMMSNKRKSIFISLNENSRNMSTVVEIFIKLGLNVQIARQGRNFYLIKCESEDLLFINASNYLKGNYDDIIRLFDLDIQPEYFPSK
jgi:hypothetical protein